MTVANKIVLSTAARLFVIVGTLTLPFVSFGDGREAPVYAATATPGAPQRGVSADTAMAVAVLFKYQDALNAGSAVEAMKVYAPDAVLMAPNAPPRLGKVTLSRLYSQGFSHIKFRVKFKIEEVRQLAPNWIFARTASAGSTELLASGKVIPEENQELFILHKIAGLWKIARYSFSTTLPT